MTSGLMTLLCVPPLLAVERLPERVRWPVVTLGLVLVALALWREWVRREARCWVALVALCGAAVLGGALLAPEGIEGLRRLAGVLAGLLILVTVAQQARRPAVRSLCLDAYLAAGVVVLGFGLLQVLRGSTAVNQNALGGTALLFLLPAGWLVLEGRAPAPRRALAAVVTLAAAAALVASGSRTAWLACALPVAVVLHGRVAARWSRYVLVLCAVPTVACAVSAWWLLAPWGPMSHWGTVAFGPALDARFELWWRAVAIISDAPLTGIGLGAFDNVVGLYVPPTTMRLDEMAHAHNIWLQVALDAGIPGALAYVGFLVAAAGLVWRAGPATRGAAYAMAAPVLAAHLFGTADAIAFGSKVGTFVWWSLGLALAAALDRERQ